MSNAAESSATVTLATCEREPIHIPGAIQPHGALLALSERDLVVRNQSENAATVLGSDQPSTLGARLEALLDAQSVADIREAIGSASLREQNPIKLRTRSGERIFDGILHRSSDLLIVELEPTQSAVEQTFGSFYRRVRKAVATLRETQRVLELATLAADEVRALTGFDRVMIYRFAHDASGEVIAEAKRADLEPFLGLHYPASDIPAQARRLYLLNWLRLIADVDYTPARIEPPLSEARGEPIDLSFSVLRSVSPIHVEYLRNMGVRASMSISLVVDGKLWGLVACHHYEPRFVPYEARAAAEFLGEALSWQIAARERSDTFELQASAHRTLSKLVEKMTNHATPVDGVTAAQTELLALVGATGAALFYEGKRALIGETPPFVQVQAFVQWLGKSPPAGSRLGTFVTDALAHDHPDAPKLDGVVGVLAVAIDKDENDFLLWFRPEVERTVSWGGDPNKTLTVDDGVPRLSPRGSFALWKETVRGTSIPFEPWQADIAAELRAVILGGIQKRAMELTRLNEELRASNFAKDEFLATVSHELRTPLNAMLGWLQLIETGELPTSKRQQAMETITRNARNQAKLVEDLLDVSRITSGKMRLDVQPVDPANAVESALESVRPAAEAKKIRLEAILDPKAGPITGDPQRLQQVVWNLLTNAIKFTGKEGKIKVRLARVESSVEISVSDDGIGIHPEFLPHVFDRFRQADGATKRNHKGLGLGLAIVKHLVELHGGQVFASSEGEGTGATFVVRLPTAPVRAQPQGPHPENSDRASFEPTQELTGLRILVVDDEPDATELLGAVLATCGVVVTQARSGYEALEVLQRTRQDILVSDIGMPGMDGMDLIRQVRMLPPEQNGRIAAVALTAFTRTQDRSKAFLAGFDVYLPKPVDANELVALLVSLRGRVGPQETSVATAASPSLPPEMEGVLANARVLIVDDPSLQDRELLATVIRRAGATVEVTEDGDTALSIARQLKPNVLVCATRLPNEDGHALLRRLRTDVPSGGRSLPAIALLEGTGTDEIRRALLAGFQIHIARPVSPEVVVSRITRLIGWSGEARMTPEMERMDLEARLSTGIEGLDVLLDGGLIHGGVYLVMGYPGTGKTTLANHICFEHVARGGKVVYVTLLAETHSRMLRNLDAFDFFRPEVIGAQLIYLGAYLVLTEKRLTGLLQMLRQVLADEKPSLLVIDGISSAQALGESDVALKEFVAELQVMADMSGCTTLLAATMTSAQASAPEHSIVDGLVELTLKHNGQRTFREIEVLKFRGANHYLGGHNLEIARTGIVVRPRTEMVMARRVHAPSETELRRVSTGVPNLDAMLGGGFLGGSTTMLLGFAGSGKTMLAMHFLDAGAALGEPGLHFGFYESEARLLESADSVKLPLRKHVEQGLVDVLWQPPLRFELDALAERLLANVARRGVKRVTLDGLDGLRQSAVYPDRLTRFVTALVNELRARDVTLLLTEETQKIFGPEVEIRIEGMSALVENIILLEYLDLGSELRRLMSIVKQRGSAYDASIRELHITENGIHLADDAHSASDILHGIEKQRSPSALKPASTRGGVRGRPR